MEQSKCKVCGGNIVCTVRRANLYFYINEKGKVERDENPDLWEYDPIHFHCENDKEHEISIDEKWKNKFIEKIYKNI